ncbi:MAG: hemolysin family protein [Fibrobacterota bacterium]
MESLQSRILIVVFLILLNGLFAMAEIAIISARKSRLQKSADRGNKGARAAIDLAGSPTRFLSTVQFGITLISIFLGAFGGAKVANAFKPLLLQHPLLVPHAEGISIVLVVTGITFLSVILGELIPKRIALHAPEKIAILFALPMQWVSALGFPIVKFLSWITDSVFYILHLKPSADALVTEDDIRHLIAQGAREGAVNPSEREMVERVFRFGDKKARAIMTPRSQIQCHYFTSPISELYEKASATQYDYLPIVSKSMANVIGILHVKDLLNQPDLTRPTELRPLLKKPLYINESMPALLVLEKFKSRKTQYALVVDEYGDLVGAISTEDILDALVGDIPDNPSEEVPSIIKQSDNAWLADAALSFDDFKSHFNITHPLDEEESFNTLGGFVINHLGHIPQEGEYFQWENLKFAIMDAAKTHLVKILIERVKQPAPESGHVPATLKNDTTPESQV